MLAQLVSDPTETWSALAAAVVAPVPRPANEDLARGAYVRYVREVRAEGGEPSNYHRWLVEYGYDEDEAEEHTTVERKVVR